MAKENYVFFIGQVKNKPNISCDEEGRPIRATMSVRTLSRDIYGRTGEFEYNNCEVSVMSGNPRIIRDMSRIEPFDFVEVKGTVTTRKIKRKVTCPFCQKDNIFENNFCYVTPTYVNVRAHASSRTAGLEYLKSCAEASNIFKGIGRLCVDPKVSEYEDGSVSCHYQVAINRKLFIDDGHSEIHTDYPWIKTTGQLAKENSDVLQTGSLLFIDGYLRSVSKTLKRRCDNKECMNEFEYKSSVMEIIPYSVEYLQNCVLPDSTHISDELRQQIQETMVSKNIKQSELKNSNEDME